MDELKDAAANNAANAVAVTPMEGGGGGAGAGAGAAPVGAAQTSVHYSIPGILHFLQHEWSRFEMDRAQWEVEKAELQVIKG